MKLQNLVNHVTMILDKSGSMKSHRAAPVAFDREIENLKKMSVDIDQSVDGLDRATIAREAYRYADAMIDEKERE